MANYLGVPCSGCEVESLIPCTREDEAVAVAFGMWLAGVEDVEVFMQNSGLGHCIDTLTSLVRPYGAEVKLIVYKGSNTPQHKIMNEISDILLELVK